MKPLRQINKRYRQILIASLISSGSILPLLPALADPLSPTGGQNSAAPGEIQNQATAEYLDSADNTSQAAVSDIVKVTVAEIAGISANPATSFPINNGGLKLDGTTATPLALPTRYPDSTVYFDFIVKNEGNDPTQLFIPGAPSVATVGGTAVTAGQMKIVSYSTVPSGANPVTTTAAAVNTPVNQTTGTATDSVPAGGYVTVRVPIKIPFGTANNAVINVTLGNTTGSPGNTNVNTPYIASGGNTLINDLVTQDNTTVSAATGEVNTTAPFNGEREASASQTTTVVVPQVTISGKVYDDANGSAAGGFATIQNGTEAGAVATPDPVYAVLVNSSNQVIQSVKVVNNGTNGTTGTSGTNGTYSFTNVDGYQNNLYIILSSTSLAANTNVTALSQTLPAGWAATSPLKYTAFNVTDAAGNVPTGSPLSYIDKDFGIDLLPIAVGASASGGVNAVGVNSYPVPASVFTSSTDSDPSNTTTTSGVVAYKITAFPTNVVSITINGTTYDATSFATAVAANGGVQFTLAQLNANAVTVDPIDGASTVKIPFKAIDTAGKLSTDPADGFVPFSAGAVTISGTVINDKDKSAITTPGSGGTPTTFTNVKTGVETGTDTKFGTNGTSIYATLYNTDTNTIIASQLIPNTGLYTFSTVGATTNVKVILSTATPGANGTATAPASGLPVGWLGTTAQDSGVFNTGNYGTNVAVGGFAPKDFGVIQKAKLVIVKRITKIGSTAATMSNINPNDNTSLAGSTSDSFNFLNATKNPTVPATYAGNWPAGYLVGATDAGKVKPGDFIEYTIYFMNNQGADAKNVKICDSIRGSQDYVLNSTSINLTSSSTASGSAIADTAPRLSVFSGSSVPASCSTGVTATGTVNGGVAIDITGVTAAADQPVGIPGATGTGTANSYGMFRFRTQVKP